MANIHLIGGEKGGVGKSLVARILAQYLIDKQLPFLGFDTDRSHGALMRFYGGFASPVLVDRYEALDSDCRGRGRATRPPDSRRSGRPDARISGEVGGRVWVLELAEGTGIAFYYWHVMDGGKDSVDLLSKLLDRFTNRLRYVLVLNQLRGDDFSILKQSGEEAKALALGARTISLKRLHESAIQKIDARSSSFWAATNAAEKESTGLGLMDRQRVKMWLQAAYREIDAVGV